MQRARMARGIKFLEADGVSPLDLSQIKPYRLRLPDDGRKKDTVPGDERLSPGHFLLGQIEYSDGAKAKFVYVKPGVTGSEAPELVEHFRREAAFPHDPTMDQLFDEDQAYRQLGWESSTALTPRRAPTTVVQRQRVSLDDIWAAMGDSLINDRVKAHVPSTSRIQGVQRRPAAHHGAGCRLDQRLWRCSPRPVCCFRARCRYAPACTSTRGHRKIRRCVCAIASPASDTYDT